MTSAKHRDIRRKIKALAIGTVALLAVTVPMTLYAGAAWADGAVYAITNALGNNEIKVYHRAADGSLTLAQTIATGGGGSGLQLTAVDALGSAGSLQVDGQHHLLFAVNTESAAENSGAGAYNTDCQQGTITSFVIASDGTLTFADRVFSGGLFPNSIAIEKGKHKGAQLLYVLNAGGPEPPAVCNLTPNSANTPNVTSFAVNSAGAMEPVGSSQPIDPGPASASSGESCVDAAGFAALTGAPAADFQCGLNPPSFPRSPAQVSLSPNGHELVVTVKGTNVIYVLPIEKDGAAGEPTAIQAPGPALPTFLGVTFDNNGQLLVAELFGSSTTIPAGGQGAVSSYTIVTAHKTKSPGLQPISSHVGDGGTAAQCIVLEPINGNFAYVSNNLSASISSYTVGSDGSVTLLNGAAASGAGPNDLATAEEIVTVSGVTTSNSFLYVVDAALARSGPSRSMAMDH